MHIWEDPRPEPSARDGWVDFNSDYEFPHPDTDRLSPVGHDRSSSSTASLTPTWELLDHERPMADLEAFLWWPPLPGEDHEVDGRGSLLTCGDVKSNPGPGHNSVHLSQGRGMLSSCGEIEPNPGPARSQQQATSSVDDTGDVVMTNAVPLSPRRSAMRPRTFTSCPEHHR